MPWIPLCQFTYCQNKTKLGSSEVRESLASIKYICTSAREGLGFGFDRKLGTINCAT